MCSRFAQFVVAHDHAGRTRLLAAQTPLGQALYQHFGLQSADYDTYILLEKGRARVKSDASLRIFALLGLPWSLAAAGRVVPRTMRDALYNLIARNRLRWFGKRDVCYAPTPEQAERFVQ